MVAGLVMAITICYDMILTIRRADDKNLNNNLNSIICSVVVNWIVLVPNLVV